MRVAPPRIVNWLLPAGIAAASLFCSGDGGSEPGADPAALTLISGDGQTGPVNDALPDPLIVRVDDEQGQPIAHVAVTWTVDGGGSVSSSTVMSGSDGLAAVERTLGPAAGEETTTASVPGLAPIPFTATGDAGELPQLVIATPPSASAEAGVPLARQPVVRVDDGSGEALGAGIPVTASVSGGPVIGHVTIKSDGYGEVHFTDLALNGPDGAYHMLFTAPNLVAIRSTAITLGGPPTGDRRLVITSQPSDAVAGGVIFPRQPVVRVEDAAGQPLGAGIPVAVSATGATVNGTAVVNTNSSGVARFIDLSLSGPDGSYHLDFSAPDASTVQSGDISLSTTSAEGGRWTQPFDWPIVAVHLVLLPTGRILSIGRVGTPQVWDPATGDFSPVPTPAWLFCSGHTILPDGRVIVAGGHISDGHGLPNITFFSNNETWSSGPPMARGRWYPTATVMGNGDVVVLAGTDEDSLDVTLPEIWSNGAIHQLTGASQAFPWYPRSFLAPDGSLFVAGPAVQTRFLSTTGSGSWRNGPRHLYDKVRSYGSAVMYDDGKVLYAGGGLTTNTAEVIDLNEPNPSWHFTGSMAFARRHLNATVLPTGEVLATGGVGGTTFDDVSKGVHAAEMWNPQSGQWTTLASNVVTRGYHSTSLLLPDGRVLHAGSGNGAGAPDERNAELYSPPYLFRGPRPVITNAPDEVDYGDQFRVLTPQAEAITHVSLIRLSAVTHAFDQNQRFVHLSFTADASGLTVSPPSSSNRAPPGHYMLFILNGNDVPSVARIIRLH